MAGLSGLVAVPSPLAAAEDPGGSASSVAGSTAKELEQTALELAALTEGWLEEGRIGECAADGSPGMVLYTFPGLLREIAGLGPDPRERLKAWKLAHVVRYSVDAASGAYRCPPGREKFELLIDPESVAVLRDEIERMIELLDREDRGVLYGHLPPQELSVSGVLEDIVDAYEAHHATMDDYEPKPEALATLRPTIYAPHVTAARFAIEYEAPLVELLEALRSDTHLQPRKREMLLLKVEFALELVRHYGKWSMC